MMHFFSIDMQDREIIRVIVDCCLHEKMFNKYYVVLASKLCSHEKNHKFSLQVYCFVFILFVVYVQALDFFLSAQTGATCTGLPFLLFVNFLYLLKEFGR